MAARGCLMCYGSNTKSFLGLSVLFNRLLNTGSLIHFSKTTTTTTARSSTLLSSPSSSSVPRVTKTMIEKRSFSLTKTASPSSSPFFSFSSRSSLSRSPAFPSLLNRSSPHSSNSSRITTFQRNASHRFNRRTKAFQWAEKWVYYHTEKLAGVAFGGLFATTGGVLYYAYTSGKLDSIADKAKDKHKEVSAVGVPLPIISFICWLSLTAFTFFYSRTKHKLDLNYLQFMSRVNFSLNTLANGRLKFRTVAERTLDQVLLENKVATKTVIDAAKRTTENDPFLRFPENETFFLMNALLNEISPLSSLAFFQADQKMKVKRAWYVLGLTFEKNAPFKKLRVQIVSEELLQEIASQLKLTSPPQDQDQDQDHNQTLNQNQNHKQTLNQNQNQNQNLNQNQNQNLNQNLNNQVDVKQVRVKEAEGVREGEEKEKIVVKQLKEITFEQSTHSERLHTIKKMAEIYVQNGTNNGSSCLWKIEMAIPYTS